MHPNVRWAKISAISALASIPGENELYIRDHRGHTMALHGIMDAIHAIRHDRYLTQRENINGSRFYWQDNTISLATNIFNGINKSVGHYAHTSRMPYDEHWHG